MASTPVWRQVVGADWTSGGGWTRPTPADMSGAEGEVELGFGPGFWTGRTYLYLEGGGSVQMESSFRPRDRDRTAERMGGFWMGNWATL